MVEEIVRTYIDPYRRVIHVTCRIDGLLPVTKFELRAFFQWTIRLLCAGAHVASMPFPAVFGQGHGGLPLPYENQVLATVVVIVHSDDRATGFVFVAGSVESDGEIDRGTRATAYGICSEIDK